MERAELLAKFPRPWRLSEEDVGVVLASDGGEVLTVDTTGDRPDEDATALAEMLVELGNAGSAPHTEKQRRQWRSHLAARKRWMEGKPLAELAESMGSAVISKHNIAALVQLCAQLGGDIEAIAARIESVILVCRQDAEMLVRACLAEIKP